MPKAIVLKAFHGEEGVAHVGAVMDITDARLAALKKNKLVREAGDDEKAVTSAPENKMLKAPANKAAVKDLTEQTMKAK